MNDDGKRMLEVALAKLVALDLQDCEEILAHLLSFDSEEDLLEHLFSLLGESNKKEIELFAQNLIKYVNGERFSFPIDIVKEVEDRKLPAQPCQISADAQISKQKQERQQTEQEKEKQKLVEQEKRIKSEEEEAIRVKMAKIRIEQEEALLSIKKKASQLNTTMNVDKSTTDDSKVSAEKAGFEDGTIPPVAANPTIKVTSIETENKTKIPLQGKAKIVCGCYGTVHKPLTNCLYCGRISCSKEGYGYCPFCTNLIDAPSMKNGSDKATLHKERLLKFDREAARRTVIYDDQADYYSNSTSTWLSEDEKSCAKSKEEARQREMHSVKKHVMNLQF